jgi:nitrogen fixation/metabolism regulation signal transduction histidine kinase
LNLTEFKDKYERKIKAIYDEIGVEYEGAKVNKEVLDEHHTDIDLEKDISNSGNSINTIVEKILKSKKMELDRLNCPYEINVDIDKQLNMDLMDISSLINNMLDNAIEAIKVYLSNDKDNEKRKKKKSGKTVKKTEIPRYIDVNAHVKDDIFVIEVKNVKSSHQETIELDGRYVSSKENKVGHGYGLYIIKRIAEKYNGKMEIDYTNKYFKNKVSIPCK